jgi:hypothetical protein
LRSNLKTIFKKIFSKNLKAVKPFDLVSIGSHPLDIEYSGFNGDIIEVPLQRCRSYILGFLPQEHPFCETLQQYNQQNHVYENSTLFQYYETYQPLTMADVLKVESSRLRAYPAMATVMPWGYSSPEQRMARFCIEGSHSRLLSKEAHKHGLNPAENYGCQFFGPISTDHGELEFQRLTSVNNKIIKEGYAPSKHGHIHGEFLIDGNNWVWIAIGGKHRFSVLSALDVDTIPVAKLSRWATLFVRRSEVEFWPNVRSGLFTVEEALSIFDRIMKGVKTSDYL